jgi:large subunit ribosomal protein L1
MARGKKYQDAIKDIDLDQAYPPQEAIALVKKTSFTKFDATIEAHLRTGLDPRKADQQIRSTVQLPHGTGKQMRVLVFAEGEGQKAALDAGADFAGNDEFIEKIKGGWLEFDKAVATPDMMGSVGKIGKILGPRGLMPNAKTGTVTFDVARAVQELKAGKIEFRVEKAGIVHVPMGKVSFGVEKIVQNLTAFLETIVRLKPASSKGTYLKGVAISTTMGPGVKIDTALVKDLVK